MKLVVAEYASVGKDGLFTVIRGGIEFWRTRTLPIDISIYVLLEVPPGALQAGVAPLHVSARDSSGSSICEIIGQAEITQPQGALRAAFVLAGRVSIFGPLTINAAIGVETATQIINVTTEEPGN